MKRSKESGTEARAEVEEAAEKGGLAAPAGPAPVPASPMAKREGGGKTLSRFYPVKSARPVQAGSPRKAKTRHSEEPPTELPVGWVMGAVEAGNRSRNASYSASPSDTGAVLAQAKGPNAQSAANKQRTASVSGPQPVPNFSHPSKVLLEQNGFVQQVCLPFPSFPPSSTLSCFLSRSTPNGGCPVSSSGSTADTERRR